MRIALAKEPFLFDEIGAESPRFEIRIILAIAQADSNGLAFGPFVQRLEDAADQLMDVVAFVEQPEQRHRDIALSLVAPLVRNIAEKGLHDAASVENQGLGLNFDFLDLAIFGDNAIAQRLRAGAFAMHGECPGYLGWAFLGQVQHSLRPADQLLPGIAGQLRKRPVAIQNLPGVGVRQPDPQRGFVEQAPVALFVRFGGQHGAEARFLAADRRSQYPQRSFVVFRQRNRTAEQGAQRTGEGFAATNRLAQIRAKPEAAHIGIGVGVGRGGQVLDEHRLAGSAGDDIGADMACGAVERSEIGRGAPLAERAQAAALQAVVEDAVGLEQFAAQSSQAVDVFGRLGPQAQQAGVDPRQPFRGALAFLAHLPLAHHTLDDARQFRQRIGRKRKAIQRSGADRRGGRCGVASIRQRHHGKWTFLGRRNQFANRFTARKPHIGDRDIERAGGGGLAPLAQCLHRVDFGPRHGRRQSEANRRAMRRVRKQNSQWQTRHDLDFHIPI
ncbi:MAG: hypothetical protein BWZ10_00598 [candidate division BRC1 bacterium ADurb.BinA364]|nr:MAG: hypothetical protein BWZ10_00598 [candidate division BRC1 bacterium ADurb.BinA364]